MKASRVSVSLSRHGLAHASPGCCSLPLNHLSKRSCSLIAATPTPRLQRRFMASSAPFGSSALKSLLRVSDEVSEAVAADKPVVALESTIYTHGALGNDLAREHEELVRSHGGIPAIIAIVDGVPTVGVSPKDIRRMIDHEGTSKASRRDISYLVGMGLAGHKLHGGTTISGTMLLARLAGIRVFGTGGLGGVHRGGHDSMDVSADLTELGRTRVAVISSGCKGFLDIPRTLEFLETQGCLVSTFADGRSGSVDFPAFWARDSGTKSPNTIQSEKEAAAMIFAQEKLGIESGMLFANPISEQFAIPAAEHMSAIEQAVEEANAKGFTGSRNTPFVLERIKQLAGHKAVEANKALVRENIVRATNVAVELSRLLSPGSNPVTSSHSYNAPTKAQPSSHAPVDPKADILVAGAVAVDLSCDYTVTRSGDSAPQLHTSNPSSISQSVGGVGYNVALAAHMVSKKAPVKFCSMVGDDIAGSTVLSALQASGIDTGYVQKLDSADHPGSRTAQYIAVNDGNRNLVLAMADMDIFTQHSFPEQWASTLEKTKPKWLVVDGNWGAKEIRYWVKAAKDSGCKVAFEPVSAEKSKGLFFPQKGHPSLKLFPEASIDLASPNTYELAAMYSEAKENGYMDSPEWFDIINTFGMTGARDKFVRHTSLELTDAGVPVQSVQLLPFIPTVITKLGAKGVLLTALLGRDDPRLRDPEAAEFIMARAMTNHPTVGGIYMRLFPPVERVDNIVSVNGAGDTFLGVLISGLAQGGSVEKLIDVAQKGAVLSLKYQGAVSPKLSSLEDQLFQVASNR